MKNFIKRHRTAFLSILVVLGLIGCATQPASSGMDLPGFWMGLVHGFLIFISMIGSFFSDVRIYAFPNGGTFYDLGYVLGAMLSLGGTGVSIR